MHLTQPHTGSYYAATVNDIASSLHTLSFGRRFAQEFPGDRPTHIRNGFHDRRISNIRLNICDTHAAGWMINLDAVVSDLDDVVMSEYRAAYAVRINIESVRALEIDKKHCIVF